MGALVEKSTQMATTALIEGDKELAQRVREGDDEIDAMFLDIEKRSLALLAQQAPVAGDLRLIVAILRVVNDLERPGDLAYNIAKLVQMEDFREPRPQGRARAGGRAGRRRRAGSWARPSTPGRPRTNSWRPTSRCRTTCSTSSTPRLIEQLVELKGRGQPGPGHPPGHGGPLLRAHRRPRRQPGRARALLRHRRRGVVGLKSRPRDARLALAPPSPDEAAETSF